VVREANLMLTGKRMTEVEFEPVPARPAVRAAEARVGDQTLRVAVVSGLGAARALVAAMDRGEVSYDIVEVMACPGGCAGGGGQPIPNETRTRALRTRGLHSADRRQQIRVARDNPLVGEVYRKWLGTPNSPAAHEALHTHYSPRRRIVGEEVAVTATPTAAPSEPLEVSVCVGTNCYLKGSREVLQRLAEEIRSRNLGERVQLRAAFCFENCGRGPTVKIDGARFSAVRPDDTPSLIDRYVVGRGAEVVQ
jgi:NADH-quinone oxidoreductase subunit G